MVARPGLGRSSDRDPPLLIGGNCHSRHFPIPNSDSSPGSAKLLLKNPQLIELRVLRIKWWRDPDLNRGHMDFQSIALPTELSRHIDALHYRDNR